MPHHLSASTRPELGPEVKMITGQSFRCDICDRPCRYWLGDQDTGQHLCLRHARAIQATINRLHGRHNPERW